MHATTKLDRSKLRILWGPRRMHHLNGNVVTPLFRHLGSSSWHSWDAAFFKVVKKLRVSLLPCIIILVSFSVGIWFGLRKALKTHREQPWHRKVKAETV